MDARVVTQQTGRAGRSQNRMAGSAFALISPARSGAMRIYKLATHDGNYTVYRNRDVVCCGLTRSAADALMEHLTSA
jgi:hypothetical protein